MDINEKSKEIQTKIEEKKNENLEKDEDFKFKLPKEIKYEKKNPDNKGVFYYPLTKNFISIEEEKKFNHYYGEEYVDRISRIDKLNKKESYLQDDILTNLIFLYLLCSKSTDNDLLKSIKSSFKMKNFAKTDVYKRIKLLYDRYHGLADEGKSEFWYMSCKMHEKKNILTLFQNNKQLYCNIDNIYDCSLHSSIDPNFDNPSCYDEIKYLKSYKKLLEYSICYLYGENSTNNSNTNNNENNFITDNITENEINNDESFPMSLSKSDDKKVKEAGNNNNNLNIINNNENNNNNDLISNASSKIQSYNNSKENEEINNEIILENKDGSNKTIYINKKKEEENANNINNNSNSEVLKNHILELVLEFNQTLKNIKCHNSVVSQIKKIKVMAREEKKPCSNLCYKNFLQCEENLYNQTFQFLKDKKFPDVYEILFIKFLQMTKYDPCHIYKLMKSFINKKNSQNGINFTINCSEIYIHLLLYKFRIKNIIRKELFDLNIKERDLTKRNNRAGITSTQSRKIEENNLRKKYLTYNQCVHFGNEICDDSCYCSKRGYCEIYCKCNQILCKFAYHGCHCSKGDCTTNHCPCFMNGRECNPQRCKNCNIIKNNDRCKNIQLQQNYESKLIVGMSDIAGWGLFANEDIKKDSLIGEYKGELINDEIVNKRDRFKDYERSTYMFKLDDEYTVDSRRMGNMLRYANHSKINSNSYTKIIFSNGLRKIGLFAKRYIKKGEEILFDYDGQGILGKQFPWINNEKKINSNININNDKNINRDNTISNENNINNSINIDKNTTNNIINNDIIIKDNTNINNKPNINKYFSKRKVIKKNLSTSTINLKEDSFNKEEITNEINNQKKEILKETIITDNNIKDNIIIDNILNKNNIKDNKLKTYITLKDQKDNSIFIKESKIENSKDTKLINNMEKNNINNSQIVESLLDKIKIKSEVKKEKSGTNIIDVLSNKNFVANKIHSKNLFKTEEDQIQNIRDKYYKSKNNNVFNLMNKINEKLSIGEKPTKLLNKKRFDYKFENKFQTNKLNINTNNNYNNKDNIVNNENSDNTMINNIFHKDEKNFQSVLFKEVKKYIDEKEDLHNDTEEKINIEIKDENGAKLRKPIFGDMNENNKKEKNAYLNNSKIIYNSISCEYFFNSINKKPNKESINTINNILNNSNPINSPILKINEVKNTNFNFFINNKNLNCNIINNTNNSPINNNGIHNNIQNNSQLKNKTINKIYNLGTIRLLIKFDNPIVNDFIFFSLINTDELRKIENLELKTEDLQNNSLNIDFDKDICGYLSNNISNQGYRLFKDYLDCFENKAFKCSISEINSDLYIVSKGPAFNQIDAKYEFNNGKNKKLLFVIKKK